MQIHQTVPAKSPATGAAAKSGETKYSLESVNDQTARKPRLITRLADDRAARFTTDKREGVFRSGREADTFGPLENGFAYYHTFDSGHTYTALVPTEFVARLEAYLKTAPPEKEANALAYFGAQFVAYDIATGEIHTFAPAAASPVHEFLAEMGVLGKANTTMTLADGKPIMRIEGVSDLEAAKFLATSLAYSKHVLDEEKLFVDWERITGANEGKKGSGWFSAQATNPNTNNAKNYNSQDIRDHIEKVLAKSVKMSWATFTHAGQFGRTKAGDFILGRVMHEIKHGNYAPMMALASYVPIMIAADTAKGLLQGGGDTPEWKKGWGVADYVGYGVQRAGLLGVGQFGLDIAEDIHRGGIGIGALTGPAIEQMVDVLQTAGGHKSVGSTVMDALPANALYKEALGGPSGGEPMFTS